MSDEKKMFPLQFDRESKPGPRSIPWEIAEEAYAEYNRRYSGQTLQRLSERGGFSWGEMDMFLPGWRERVDLVTNLKARVEHLEGAVVEKCDLGHKFVKLPDHPKRDGLSRCPHCMAEGLDKLREKLEKVHHFETPIPSLMPDLPNANGRIYPKGVIEKAVADYQERIKEKTALVYVEPKDPGRPQFAEAGGIITELTVEDGVVFAKGHAIDTPAGGILKEFLDVKNFDLTPCGSGSEQDRKVEDGYELKHFSVSMGGLPPCSMGFKEMPEEDEGEKEERDENSD